ncbi:hypothetical protein [Leifsonia sp. fls2-241-R2A-40a]|uniref:hypothetical protein n=1 Tax=Leifsonia sp. fls2-241-R2A-40a TaxID=3040290 RepID=UPI00254C86D3|nr:hypothetical protein [Leifsonia sp. fls2-241-R2A-40a]
MTVTPERSPAQGQRPSADSPGAEGADRDAHVPVRADGVQLLGSLRGSGYREPPALVRRSDGQTLQLTPLLYAILDEIDGRSSSADVAARASDRVGRLVGADDVDALIDSSLRPLGLLTRADGSQPELKRSDPLLALRLRKEIVDPEATRRVTAPFAALFHPLAVIPVLCLFVAACWWLLAVQGLAGATYQAFQDPGVLLLIVAVTIVSAGFHEFGHAAAARYGGATPGRMGVGLYLFWPAFFTDVTDSYRLGRAGRVRTDLGGLYFNAIVAVVIVGVWWVTRYDALLLVVVTQLLQMLHQLLPMVRFDGYHVLADLTGVPDLFQRIRPTLLGLLPWRWNRPESRMLKPWARAVVSVWVLTVVPLLIFSLAMMVLTLPRVLATAWVALSERGHTVAGAFGRGDATAGAAQLVLMAATALPVLGTLYILLRLARSGLARMWTSTRGRPVRRGIAAATVLALIAGLAWAWWPAPQTYRPIQAYERGTISDIIAPAQYRPGHLSAGSSGQVQTIWTGGSRPTADHPQLAMVLLPRTTNAPSWVFPFDKPLPPRPGDNQALAVNTTDGSVLYDVAFALVWVTDGASALNTNGAYAFAKCSGCTTVAVGFQVVLVVGQSDVVVPQNLSVAANYGCLNCLTAALAEQLVITLSGPPSAETVASLNALWAQIMAFSKNLGGLSMTEVQAQLQQFEQQLKAVIQKDPSATPATGSTPAPTAPPTSTATPAPGSGPTAAPGTDATAPPAAPGSTPGPAGTPAASPEPSAEATAPAEPSTPTATPTP